jgi:hypothetical protein
MHYEEKVVNGVLWCRSCCRDDAWRPVGGMKGAVFILLCKMTSEERAEIARLFEEFQP